MLGSGAGAGAGAGLRLRNLIRFLAALLKKESRGCTNLRAIYGVSRGSLVEALPPRTPTENPPQVEPVSAPCSAEPRGSLLLEIASWIESSRGRIRAR